jgi:hypothetical protein
MINPVTPWTATVQADIVNSVLLFEMTKSQYKLQIHNAGDSIWLTAEWPETGSIAFRLAFGMNSDFERTSVSKTKDGILVFASTRLGDYTISVSFPKSDSQVFRYTTTFTASFPY